MVKKKKRPEILSFSHQKSLYQTIKVPFRKIVKDETFYNRVNDLVIKCNHIVIDTYSFIRLYTLYQYHHQLPIPDIDNEFVSYCISALSIRDNRGKKSKNTDLLDKLNEFYNNEFQPIFNHTKYNISGLSFTKSYLVETISTCISTNLKEHFVKRLFRFINIFGGIEYDNLFGIKKNEYIIKNNIDMTTKEKTFKQLQKDYMTEKKAVLWKLKKSVIENKYNEIPEFLQNWFQLHRPFLLPTEFNKSIPYDCEVSPFKYIPYCFYMNEKYEEFNQQLQISIQEKQNNITEENRKEMTEEIKLLNKKKIKLFQPLSLRKSCIPKYITLDTASLINLFLNDKGDKTLLQKIKDNQIEVWERLFRMNKKIFHPIKTKNNKKTKEEYDYLFNYTLQTDGVGCSLLFHHKSIKDKKYGGRIPTITNDLHYIDDLQDEHIEQLQLKNKKIVCADPGRFYMMYMMDDEGNKLTYSCCQRDTESLAKRNRRIMMTNKRRNIKNTIITDEPNIIQLETALSNYCSNTIHYEGFKDFIREKHRTNENTSKFYEKLLYRKLNWRKKTYRQRSEDKFINNIEKQFGEKENIVICIGDWSNRNTIKGLASSMGIGLKRLIHKKYTTLQIDEYNTSKKCCNCWKDIENVEINKEKKFRLLRCNNCSKCNISSPEDENKLMFHKGGYLTRDKNSCINMISIAKQLIYKRKRPQEFQRGDEKLPLL